MMVRNKGFLTRLSFQVECPSSASLRSSNVVSPLFEQIVPATFEVCCTRRRVSADMLAQLTWFCSNSLPIHCIRLVNWNQWKKSEIERCIFGISTNKAYRYLPNNDNSFRNDNRIDIHVDTTLKVLVLKLFYSFLSNYFVRGEKVP